MAFEKIKLATGELRSEYIVRRLGENAAPKAILAEINAPGFYSGPEGKTWAMSVIYAEQGKARAAKPAAEPAEAPIEVAPEHEGTLTPADMQDIYAEAKAALTKKQRAAARKEALAKATQALELEARLAEQRGSARGDMVDISIDLAPYAADIRLDGKVFRHGAMVRVNRKVAAVLAEQMRRSWEHESSLRGADENAYRTSSRRGVGARAGMMGYRA